MIKKKKTRKYICLAETSLFSPGQTKVNPSFKDAILVPRALVSFGQRRNLKKGTVELWGRECKDTNLRNDLRMRWGTKQTRKLA